MEKLPKTYNAKAAEDAIYQKWETSGFFNPDNLEKADDRFWKAEVFSIAMPPPNATGELHVGHAMMLALEDLLVRHARMTGKKTFWLPGTDHAAIATNYVVERQLWEKEKKTRTELGREEFLKRVEEFVAQTQGKIQKQIRKMGSSCDWSREKYTLSPELSLAVRTVFKRMYDSGLIYRGERIVNWCSHDSTTLADDEVEYHEFAGKLYYISYPLSRGKGHLTVATTRPETMLADTAIAVNPKDSRYKKFIGQSVMLPLVNRELPIIADKAVDPKFGTGVLKITPGHHQNDFEIGLRNKLETINLFNREGKIDSKEASDHGFESYSGLTPGEARTKILEELTAGKFLEKTEDLKHNVGQCYRCGIVIEPIVSKQWFVNVNEKFKTKAGQASLKEIATAAVKSGAIKIIPERFAKTYLHWMGNLRDWNISRQIWFGHRVPVYYCDSCGQTMVEIEPPQSCSACASQTITQDSDTLDTWFSSGLWTFSTLGWPAETSDLKTYHPTTVLETGYDILFFWVARMIIMTEFALGEIPFKTVYLHGLVRDEQGQKMSKSKGNVLNPLDMIDKYGTDALRLSLIIGVTPGNDSKISEEKIKTFRNFVNKLWNISRYILGNHQIIENIATPNPNSLADEWILQRLDEVIAQVNQKLLKFEINTAGETLIKFTWDDLADWYLEIAKIEGMKDEILSNILQTLLQLWHPFAPFVTEHIWANFSNDLLMVQKYPTPAKTGKSPIQFGQLQDLVRGYRNLRSEYRQDPKQIFSSYLELPENLSWIKAYQLVVEKLAKVKLNFEAMDETKKMPYFLWNGVKVWLVTPNFDRKKELELTEKELKNTNMLWKKLSAQLEKKAFLKKAPPGVVAKLKKDFEDSKLREEKLRQKIIILK